MTNEEKIAARVAAALVGYRKGDRVRVGYYADGRKLGTIAGPHSNVREGWYIVVKDGDNGIACGWREHNIEPA